MTSRKADRSTALCISGWYGTDNSGDEAILTQFLREMAIGEDCRLTIFAANAQRAYSLYARESVRVLEHQPLVGLRPLFRWIRGRLNAQIEAIRGCDLFVLGGGSLIHDRSTLRNLIGVLDELWLARLFGRRTALYAIGIGPLRRRSARWLVRKTLSHCDLITVRDRGSARLLVEIGLPEAKIHIVADPALLLRPTPLSAERLSFLKPGPASLKDKAVGIFLNDDLGANAEEKSAFIAALAAALDRVHEEYGFSFVFLPMMTQPTDDDRLLARKVLGKMRHGTAGHLVERDVAPDEMVWLASLFRMNVTVRLHALLYSLAMKTPVVAISYDPKVANAMAEFGLAEFSVPLAAASAAQLHAKIAAAEKGRETYLAQIDRLLPQRQDAARHTFALLRRLLEGNRPDQRDAPRDRAA